MNITEEIMLTSLALGELQGEEKKRAEGLVATDLAAKSFFDEMVGLTTELESKMSEENAPGLDPVRRAVIEKVTAPADGKPKFFADLRPLAVAAGLVLAISGAISFSSGSGIPVNKEDVSPKEVAEADSREGSRVLFEAQDKHAPFKENKNTLSVGNQLANIQIIDSIKPRDGRAVNIIPHAEITTVPDPAQRNSISSSNLVSNLVNIPLKNDTSGNVDLGNSKVRVGTVTPGGGFLAAPGGAPGAKPGSGGLFNNHVAGATPGGGVAPTPGGSAGPGPAGFGTTGGGPGGVLGGLRRRAKVPLSKRASRVRENFSKDLKAGRFAGGKKGGKISTYSTAGNTASKKKWEYERLIEEAFSQTLSKKDKAAVKFFIGERSKDALIREGLSGDELVKGLETEIEALRLFIGERKREAAGESYAAVRENDFSLVGVSPLSTIGLDVDTASYANIRRHLNSGVWPPRDAVRVDEMVNYFHYDDPQPESGEPLRVHAEVASCPWNLENRLLRIGFRAKTIARDARGPSNLVFLIDVSGSMKSADKLPLLIRGLKAMVNQLGEDDRVAIVTYSGSSGVVLPATRGHEKSVILAALDRLTAKGSTNGASGIELAYSTAGQNFDVEGTNRVILCTDGDFNVGVSDTNSLIKIIKEKAKSGIFLSVLGFGTGNIKDDKMEALANKGNGHYAYIDTNKEANKVLVEELEGTLITVAKDCKLQVEFNPTEVASYRLLGYTNRILAAEDFNDDTKDAGEIGAGHTVVALYEICPAKNGDGQPLVDPLKYQKQVAPTKIGAPGEVATLKVRYKLPDQDDSRVRILTVMDEGNSYSDASTDFKLSSSVALFGMILSRSQYVGQTSLDTAFELSLGTFGAENDPGGLRKELSGLIQAAKIIAKQTQRK